MRRVKAHQKKKRAKLHVRHNPAFNWLQTEEQLEHIQDEDEGNVLRNLERFK